jgi:translocation and assembly module TamB
MGLNLKVSAKRGVFIRSGNLDTEWSFDATAGGTTAKPTVVGSAELVRGNIMIAGEPFNIDTGHITFDGDPEQARLDLSASQHRADLDVTLHVTGTPTKPVITLESTPSYPQDEILSRMLFGTSKAQLSGVQNAQLGAAVASLAGGAGYDLLSPVRQTLGLSSLHLGGGTGGQLLSAGRYLGNDVYFQVSSGVSLAEAAIEWEIRPHLELGTRFGFGRDSAVTFRWRKEY